MTFTTLVPILALSVLFFLLTLSTAISKTLSKKTLHTPFECGFNPLTPLRLPFSLQFFFITILFLIFDIEIILILPFPLLGLKLLYISTSMISVILILMMGLLYEWTMDYLQWK